MVGAAVASHERQTSGGYDLIPADETPIASGFPEAVHTTRPLEQSTAGAPIFLTPRGDRLASLWFVFLVLGIVAGVACFNMATRYSASAETSGTITEVDVKTRSGRPAISIVISTPQGEFYKSGRPGTYPDAIREAFLSGEQIRVTVRYSTLTNGLVEIEELDHDRDHTVPPAVVAVTTLIATSLIVADFRKYRDGVTVALFGSLYFVIGPVVGWLSTDSIAAVVRVLYH